MEQDLVERYLDEGFVALRGAVEPDVAEECARLLWQVTGLDRDDPATWTQPVVWVPVLGGPAVAAAANAPALVEALDLLVGPGRWTPRRAIGSFPLRFPHPVEPDDAGWHVEASFPPDGESDGSSADDYSRWRVDVSSRGRAALLLFLFSEVGPDDAPTCLRVGSHLDVPAVLAPYGDAGVAALDVAGAVEAASRSRPTALATGGPGDVFVCHPFLVHRAQPHHGTRPRLMAQPSIEAAEPVAPFAPGPEASWPVAAPPRSGGGSPREVGLSRRRSGSAARPRPARARDARPAPAAPARAGRPAASARARRPRGARPARARRPDRGRPAPSGA